MKPRVVALAALMLVAAACSSSSAGTHSGSPGPVLNKTTAHYQQLVKAADLTDCPVRSSAATAPSGGLPNLTLECLGAGPSVHLAGLSGRPAVVNLWGSWCTECGTEAAYLSKAYDADRHAVTFLGVDTEDEWDGALTYGPAVSPPVRYPSVFDEDRKAMIALHVSALPFTAFVSADGQIVHTVFGPFRSLAALQKDITAYLHVRT